MYSLNNQLENTKGNTLAEDTSSSKLRRFRYLDTLSTNKQFETNLL